MSIVVSNLAGLQFRPAEAKEAVKELEVGMTLVLEAEPENPYDENAVKVLNDEGMFLGYLDKMTNAKVAAALSSDLPCECVVAKTYLDDQKRWMRPLLHITIED